MFIVFKRSLSRSNQKLWRSLKTPAWLLLYSHHCGLWGRRECDYKFCYKMYLAPFRGDPDRTLHSLTKLQLLRFWFTITKLIGYLFLRCDIITLYKSELLSLSTRYRTLQTSAASNGNNITLKYLLKNLREHCSSVEILAEVHEIKVLSG